MRLNTNTKRAFKETPLHGMSLRVNNLLFQELGSKAQTHLLHRERESQ